MQLRRPVIRIVAPFAALIALVGCMLVDNFSPAWEKGATDSCVNKIAESLYYTEFRRDPAGKDMDTLARTLTLGQTHFLMLKQDVKDEGGRMYRFGIINGIFQRYRPNPTMKKTFQQNYPDAPVSFEHDTLKLKALDEKTIALLTEVGAKQEYWEIEDQTLYNTMLNPLCKFDDRDLQALSGK